MSYTATSILGNFSVTKFLTNLTLAAILWLLILQAFQFLRKCIHFRRIEQTIPGPFSVPFFGSVFWLSLNADNCLEKILDSVKPYWPELVRYSAFNKLHVMVNDADHIAKVLRDRHLSDKPWMFYGPLKPIIRDGIFTSNGEPWQAHRLVITPTFHAEVMGRYVEILDMEAKEFVDKLSGMLHKDVDCSDTMIRTASFMAIRTMMSSTLNERECSILEEIISLVPRALKSVNRRSLNPFLWPDWIFKWTQMYRDTEAAKTLFDMLINSIIQRKSSEIHATASRERQLASKLGFRDRKSLLDLLLESKFSGELRMTDEDILNETSTMFNTAFDTPVIVVTFVLKVLSIRPDIQELVYAEICDVLQDKDHKLSSDDLSRLQYMDRVVNETLRMFPIAPFVARQTNKDVELDGKHIPSGTVLFLNFVGVHRSPKYHQDPLTFDPDRFLPDRAAAMHPYSFLPFSSGSRNCIGQPLAWMMVKTLLASILKTYQVFPASDGITDPSQFKTTFDLVLRYIGGVKVRFEPRN